MILLFLLYSIILVLVYALIYGRLYRAHEEAHKSICEYYGGKVSKKRISNKGAEIYCEGAKTEALKFDAWNDIIGYHLSVVIDFVFLITWILIGLWFSNV